MSYTALEKLRLHAEDSIGAHYGTLSAAMVLDLVQEASNEHVWETRRAVSSALQDFADNIPSGDLMWSPVSLKHELYRRAHEARAGYES